MRGGKREGAGRKALGPSNMGRVTVTLPPELVDYLRKIGGGNVSEGIRRLAGNRAQDVGYWAIRE